jgi:hypothetical protein
MSEPLTKDSRLKTLKVTGREFLAMGDWLKQTKAVIFEMEVTANGYELHLRYPDAPATNDKRTL